MTDDYFVLIIPALAMTIYIAGVRIFMHKWLWDARNDKIGYGYQSPSQKKKDQIKKIDGQVKSLDSFLFWAIFATIIGLVRSGLVFVSPTVSIPNVDTILFILTIVIFVILIGILCFLFKFHLDIKEITLSELIFGKKPPLDE